MSLLDRLIGCGGFVWKSGPSLSDINDAINRVLEPEEQSPMSDHETQLRLECLRLSVEIGQTFIAANINGGNTVDRAQRYYDFITGADRAALAEEAKAAVDKLVK